VPPALGVGLALAETQGVAAEDHRTVVVLGGHDQAAIPTRRSSITRDRRSWVLLSGRGRELYPLASDRNLLGSASPSLRRPGQVAGTDLPTTHACRDFRASCLQHRGRT
jgi:hypothetical protein